MRKTVIAALAALLLAVPAGAQIIGATGSQPSSGRQSSFIDHGWEFSAAAIVTPGGGSAHSIVGGDVHFGYEREDGLYAGIQLSPEWLQLDYYCSEIDGECSTSNFMMPILFVMKKYYRKAYSIQPYLTAGLGFYMGKKWATYRYWLSGDINRFALNVQGGGGVRYRISPHLSAFMEADLDLIAGRIHFDEEPEYKFKVDRPLFPLLKLGVTLHLNNPPFWQRWWGSRL